MNREHAIETLMSAGWVQAADLLRESHSCQSMDTASKLRRWWQFWK